MLSYYRDANLSRWQRQATLHGMVVLASLCFLALFITQHDPGWGAVSYGLLLWRATTSTWRGRSYTTTYPNIIAKYDTKIIELTGARVSGFA